MAKADENSPMQIRALKPTAKGDDHGDGMILWFRVVFLGNTLQYVTI